MTILINWKELQKRIINGKEVTKVIQWWVQVRPNPSPWDNYLCFTSRDSWARLSLLNIFGLSAHPVELEFSYDKITWSDYQWMTPWVWKTIQANRVWEKVYFRNKSAIPTLFSTDWEVCYKFRASDGDWDVSWDVWFLLCKYSTLSMPESCFDSLFSYFPTRTAPLLPATTLGVGCYRNMFGNCDYLEQLPSLPATILPSTCYKAMFADCPNIKISEQQSASYPTPYRIPSSWTWSGNVWTQIMFEGTWWTFTWTPSINTTYYTSNTIV